MRRSLRFGIATLSFLAPAIMIACGLVNLTIKKTGPATVRAGETITYTIVATNNSPKTGIPKKVIVTDILPAGTTFVSVLGGPSPCTVAGGTVSCPADFIKCGGRRFECKVLAKSYTYQVQVQVSPDAVCGSTIVNVAKIRANEMDTNSSDNQSTVTTTVVCDTPPPPPPQNGCIEIYKEAIDFQGNLLPAVPQFTFILDGGLTAHNLGNGRARFDDVTPGVHVVKEIIPAGWELLSVTPTNGSVQVPAGSLCPVVLFKNKQVLPPPPPPQNPDVSIVKSGPGTAEIGKIAFYTLTVKNESTVLASNVVATDNIPYGLSFTNVATDPLCTQQGGEVVCAAINLAPGEQREFKLTFTVSSTNPCNSVIVNKATVTATNDSNFSNNQSSATITVTCPNPPPPTMPQCSDGLDNDGDFKIDFFDPGCYPNGVFNSIHYNPNDNDESNGPPPLNFCRWQYDGALWKRSCF